MPPRLAGSAWKGCRQLTFSLANERFINFTRLWCHNSWGSSLPGTRIKCALIGSSSWLQNARLLQEKEEGKREEERSSSPSFTQGLNPHRLGTPGSSINICDECRLPLSQRHGERWSLIEFPLFSLHGTPVESNNTMLDQIFAVKGRFLLIP